MEVTRKQSTPNFPKKWTFLTPWYAHVLGGKSVRYVFVLLYNFFLPPFWDSPFVLLPTLCETGYDFTEKKSKVGLSEMLTFYFPWYR